SVKTAANIRRHRFGSVLYMSTRVRSDRQIKRDLLFFRISGIRQVLGIDYVKENRLSRIPDPSREVSSEGDYLLGLVTSAGLAPAAVEKSTDLLLTDNEAGAAANWLAANLRPDKTGAPLIAVAPFCKWTSKAWSIDHFRSVVNRLVGQF